LAIRESLGGRLAALSADTMADLNRLLPTTWSRGNPADIIGDASGKRYADALTTLIRDLEVDAILVLNCPTALAQAEEAARAIIDVVAAAEPTACAVVTSSQPGSASIPRGWRGSSLPKPASPPTKPPTAP
jgi:acetyltransferase